MRIGIATLKELEYLIEVGCNFSKDEYQIKGSGSDITVEVCQYCERVKRLMNNIINYVPIGINCNIKIRNIMLHEKAIIARDAMLEFLDDKCQYIKIHQQIQDFLDEFDLTDNDLISLKTFNVINEIQDLKEKLNDKLMES